MLIKTIYMLLLHHKTKNMSTKKGTRKGTKAATVVATGTVVAAGAGVFAVLMMILFMK